MFYKDENGNIIYPVIYVYDIIITIDYNIDVIKLQLQKTFKMKDVGRLLSFLGIEVSYSDEGIFICQRKYTYDLLRENSLLGSKPFKISIKRNLNFRDDKSPFLKDPIVYRRLIGRLIYINITRLDINFSVQNLSQFMQQPRQSQLYHVLTILKYLKNSPSQGNTILETSTPTT